MNEFETDFDWEAHETNRGVDEARNEPTLDVADYMVRSTER